MSLDGLLQLHAGAGHDTGSDDRYTCPSPTEPFEALALPSMPDVHDPDDEAIVHVDDDLLNRLRHEVQMEVERVRSSAGSSNCSLVCKLCPYYVTRGSHRVKYMLRHLQQRHQARAPLTAK